MKTCPSCGARYDDSVQFCTVCGASLSAARPDAQVNQRPASYSAQQPVYQQPAQQPVYQQPAAPVIVNTQPTQVPEQYRPLSPWAYFGYSLLFTLPLIGIIMLFVYAFDSSNLNRRNFARSYFISLIIALVISIVVGILVATGAVVLGSSGVIQDFLNQL